jgi:hypothetical protein
MSLLMPLAVADSSSEAVATIAAVIIAWVGIIGGIIAVVRRGGQGKTPTLVLTAFNVNPNATDTPCIEISGRPSGLVAWILTAMQLSAETTLSVTDLQVSLKSASLSGEFNNFVPLPHVSSTHCGYSKPFLLLICGVLAFAVGTVLSLVAPAGGAVIFILGLLIAAVFIAIYFLSRRITINLVTDGSVPLRLTFKPGLLSGVPVNIRSTIDALALLNAKVLSAS